MTRILGAILAGGRSSRFGSDKAVALLDGVALIERVADRLRPHCAALVLCGREVAGAACVADRPAPDLGPLGGLNAALHYAAEHGFDAVVSVPCDTPFLPDDLVVRLGEGAARYVRDMPVIGYWPVSLAMRLDTHLADTDDRSMRRWASIAGATPLDLAPLANVNTRDDLFGLDPSQIR